VPAVFASHAGIAVTQIATVEIAVYDLFDIRPSEKRSYPLSRIIV